MSENTTALATTKLEGFTNEEEMIRWANNRIESGLLPDSIATPEAVITIAQQGKELGLDPMTALNNIHVIAGRPVLSSSLLGALLKRNHVEWTWDEDFATFKLPDGKTEDKRSTIHFYWKSDITDRVMETTFSCTWKQMIIAGYTEKHNWKKYPKEMLRARTLAYGVRALFPDIMMGMYTEMEINDVAEDLGVDEQVIEVGDDGDMTIKVN